MAPRAGEGAGGDAAAAAGGWARSAAPARTIPVLACRDGPLPLSFAQQRLWFFAQLYPDSAAYHVPRVLRLRGELDTAAIGAAVNDLLARHEPLRTVFGMSDGEPRQWIRPFQPIDVPVIDLAPLPAAAREAEAALRVRELVQRPFDLHDDPMLRAAVVRFERHDHVLALVLHHIASDGWSVGVLERELSQAYAARRAGRVAELPPLAVQYADYAAWQVERLRGAVLERDLAFWRSALAGAPGRTELPAGRAPPPQPGFRGAEVELRIEAEATARLRAAARAGGATPFMLLLAVFQVLLARHAGQDDVVVGVPIAGRSRVELEGLIGMFVNTLALRLHIGDDPPLPELLARVRDTALSAFDHQDLPFEKLVDELQPARELGHNPLFNVAFAFQNVPRSGLRIDGVEVSFHPLGDLPARFDLELALAERDGGLTGRLRYDRELLDEATVRDLARRFRSLLDAVAVGGERRVSALPLMDEDERDQVGRRWAVRRSPYPDALSVPARFARVAAGAPDAVAVEDGARQLSYCELDARSDAVAAAAYAAGARRGDRVALCLPRGAGLVSAMLGVLKCGACYVPLDTGQPRARLQAMLRDAGARLVLSASQVAIDLPAGTRRLDVDALEAAAPAPAAGAGALDLACVMYTSGSTGEPKGVAVTHQAILRLVCDTDYVNIDPQWRIAQIANPAFDAVTFEVWGALLNGARTVVVPREDSLSPAAVRALVERGTVNTMFLTTALFNALVQAAPGVFAGLRCLLFGGEAADADSVRRVLAHGAPQRLLHVYGPTEATTFATWHQVGALAADEAGVPIGGPLANTTAYVLDRHLQPVPVGVHGDLYLGGDGLARGYLGRAAATAQSFVPDPLSGRAGARLYRTGDRARWRRDGALEFVGRSDDQIKIRGFRVEPGEVTAALLQHPAVAQAASVADGAPGAMRLLAYAVAAPGSAAREADLLAHLRACLPGYMVPERVVAVDRLPLTANGKLDRAALPVPDAAPGGDASPPADVVAAQVVGVWRDLLGGREPDPDDDFFAAGGHSLLSIALLAEVERVTGVRVELAQFLGAPTLRRLAGLVRRGGAAGGDGLLVPIRRRGARPPFFFIPGGGGGEAELAYVYGALAAALDREQPVYGLRAPGSRGEQPALDTVERIAAAFAAEIRALQPHGPYYLGGECIGGVVAFETARQLAAAGADIGLLILLEARPPSDRAEQRIRRVTARRVTRLHARSLREWWRRGLHQAAALVRTPPSRWRGRLAGLMRRAGAALRAQRAAAGVKRQRGGHQRTVFAYRARPYAGRITLVVPEANAEADATLGWAAFAGGGVEVHRVPGDHHSYVREHAATTAASIEHCLARSMNRERRT